MWCGVPCCVCGWCLPPVPASWCGPEQARSYRTYEYPCPSPCPLTKVYHNHHHLSASATDSRAGKSVKDSSPLARDTPSRPTKATSTQSSLPADRNGFNVCLHSCSDCRDQSYRRNTHTHLQSEERNRESSTTPPLMTAFSVRFYPTTQPALSHQLLQKQPLQQQLQHQHRQRLLPSLTISVADPLSPK